MPAPRTLRAATVLAATLALAGASGLAQQREAVPKRYQPLYSELDAALTRFEQRLPPAADTRPLRAAVLTAARCAGSEEMLQPARREALALELTALRNVGGDAAILEVCYPLLTPAFHDARPYLEHYANLANEVRLHGLKLVVRHTLLPATAARPGLQRYWTRLSRARFAAEHLDESRAILYALQPDYLTLQADRGAQPAGRRLQPQEWSRMLRNAAERLRGDAAGMDILLGAGIGPEADAALLDLLARAPGLDYLDLQVYPPWWAGQDQFERLLGWPARIRAADPARRVILSETWLHKLGRNEQARPPSAEQLRAREAFAFWAPLDRRYLELVGRLARTQALELVGIGRPHQLFAYLDFYDPIVFRLSDRALIELLQRDFATAVRTQPPTPVGRTFGAM
jgi:hypothetical protein